jgi:hypothetical protein
MLAHTLHHAAWLYGTGHYNQAVAILHHLLAAERHHPGILAQIHRAMYAINPDWGL